MKCPNCKDKELLPARLNEGDKKTGLKCPGCSTPYYLDHTNHLRPFPAQRVDEKPSTAENLVQGQGQDSQDELDEKPEEEENTPAILKERLSDEDKTVVFRMLVAGDKPTAIAKAVGCKRQAVSNYKYNHRRRIEAAISGHDIAQEVDHKGEVTAANYSGRKANVMSWMAKLRRGQVRQESTQKILKSYKAVLEYDLKKSQAETKGIKRKLEVIDDALKGMEIIDQGQKEIVNKIAAALNV
ncbi:MAG: hypothetical protein WC455_13350 [Dehalococcoidia bacterium]|jgi:endogenous inhibitor of DNA gyrase (YacG/DUF329 family)